MQDPILDIYVDGEPGPQGSKRHVGHGVMLEVSKKVRPWREAVKAAARAGDPERAIAPFSGPVYLSVAFFFARPKSHFGTGKKAEMLKASAPARKASKPDLDKLIRSTCDALTDVGVWRDDCQVVQVAASKIYSSIPGAHIVVTEWKE
jgi:crossover junction endodeoxyribonuclease RusA